MRPKSLALLLLALGCGLVASIGISQVMAKRGDSGEPAVDTQTVFVALVDIPQREPITPQMFKAEQWPKTKVPPNAIVKVEDLENRVTKSQLLAGEVILQARLMGKNEKINVPKGMRVVSVKVDFVSGTSSLITPGDRVDLLVFLQPNPAMGVLTPTTRTVLQNIKVFAVDSWTDAEGKADAKGGAAAKSVSLLVTPEQAQKATMSSEMGQVRLALRSLEDPDTAKVDEVKPQDVFGGTEVGTFVKDGPIDGGAKLSIPSGFNDMLANLLKKPAPAKEPAKEKEAEPVKAAPPPAKQHQVVVMRGSKLSEVVLEASQDASGKEKWSLVGGDDGASSGMPGSTVLPPPVNLPTLPPVTDPKPPTSDPKPPATPRDAKEGGKETPAAQKVDLPAEQ
jgi:pilus assembly protein CpaB